MRTNKPPERQKSTSNDDKTTKTIKYKMTEDNQDCAPFTSKNYQWPTPLKTAAWMNIGSTNNLESLLLCV